jgi:pSer/pThr/pTyr-binding forkhead associated (FHA) protein
LNGGVVNIGRRPDNHLVIDDARISRLHAQLRLVRGRYMLFDLESTGGTFINGERIRQHTLRPGDVISLAGVPLVYGQDDDSAGSDTQQLVGDRS